MPENNAAATTVKCIMATALDTVEIKERELEALAAGNVRIRTEYSMVSTGTELHTIQGTHTQDRPFPRMTGYIAIGRVVGVGEGVESPVPGERVLFSAAHFEMIDFPAARCVAVPEAIASEVAVCTTLLGISIRGVRAGKVQLGDAVAVFGQGVIGALAAHLAKLAGGCPVIAVDPVARRREVAGRLGVDATIDPVNEDVGERIAQLTGGRGVQAAIEATATPRVISQLPAITAKGGRIVVLGGIHGTAEMDLYTHFQKSDQIMVGCGDAHSEDHPYLTADANTKAIHRMMLAGMINIEPVITHRAPYTKAPGIYRMLINEKDKAVGVQFEWPE